ncbi:hypothetical protein GDO81_015575 [Engystomops pustulosus]|uniref:Uncharacterized protein n=1 Tax=Engystomops pustulosus TaxID=76066 RepID=A0AAV7AR77_ENGPU|nr:hypothetical protein GDO81_015575 [Engystomops pustulosus]
MNQIYYNVISSKAHNSGLFYYRNVFWTKKSFPTLKCTDGNLLYCLKASVQKEKNIYIYIHLYKEICNPILAQRQQLLPALNGLNQLKLHCVELQQNANR